MPVTTAQRTLRNPLTTRGEHRVNTFSTFDPLRRLPRKWRFWVRAHRLVDRSFRASDTLTGPSVNLLLMLGRPVDAQLLAATHAYANALMDLMERQEVRTFDVSMAPSQSPSTLSLRVQPQHDNTVTFTLLKGVHANAEH